MKYRVFLFIVLYFLFLSPSITFAVGVPPTVLTLFGSLTSTTSAKLIGQISDIGDSPPIACGYIYGLTTSYGATTTFSGDCSQEIGDNIDSNFDMEISGFPEGTAYHFKAYAQNSSGISYGEDRVVQNLLPWITDVFHTDAGVDPPSYWAIYSIPGNSSYSFEFDWRVNQNGVNASMTNTTTSIPTSYRAGSFVDVYGEGFSLNYLQNVFSRSGLPSLAMPPQFASSTGGFPLLGTIPNGSVASLSVSPPTGVTQTSVTLHGTIINSGLDSTTQQHGFEYGTTEAHSSTTSTVANLSSGNFQQVITGLSCGTTYHYSAFATNNQGTALSDDSTFETLGCSSPPPNWPSTFIVNGNTLIFKSTDCGSYRNESVIGEYPNLSIKQYGASCDSPYDPDNPATYTGFNNNLWFLEATLPSFMAIDQFLSGNPVDGFNDCLSKRFSYYPWGAPGDLFNTNFVLPTVNGALAGDPVAGRYDTTNYPSADASCAVAPEVEEEVPTTTPPINISSSSHSSGSSSSVNLQFLAQIIATTTQATITICPQGYTCTPKIIVDSLYTRNLMVGQMGLDVERLQKYLNSKGFVIATIGPGSKGNETVVFGSLTKKALIKFQKANGIPATGFFGPITKAFINTHP